MAIEEVNSTITVGEAYGNGPPNITIEGAQFWMRPNFSGELDTFNDDRRKFNLLIPLPLADQLRALGYNVRTKHPTPEQAEKGFTTLEFLKVYLTFKIPPDKRGRPDEMDFETGPEIHLIQGDQVERLTSKTVALLDHARFENIDMELRAWEYNPDEHPGQYSARLNKLVATMRPSILDNKYGRLR